LIKLEKMTVLAEVAQLLLRWKWLVREEKRNRLGWMEVAGEAGG
jgi:hypothetical protein